MVFGARLLQKPAMLVTSCKREVDSSIEPCDLIINIQWSVVTSPSNEQEGSNNKMSSRKKLFV